MKIRARSFNPQIFLELLCYLAFAVLMLYLLVSGKYLSYVTPRMKPYLISSAAIMGIWGAATFGRLFRPQHKVRSMHCFVLAIPILLVLLPHSPLGTSDVSVSYTGGNLLSGQASRYGTPQRQTPPGNSNPATGISTGDPAERSAEPASDSYAAIGSELPPEDTAPADSAAPPIPDAQPDAPDAYDLSDSPDTPYDTYDSTDLRGLDEANKKIVVSNDDFGMWISEIYTNMKKYEGYTVIMTGFIFKDPEMLGEDGFVPARLMMSCCVADLAPAGLLCKYDKVSELKKDAWVTVEGTLFIGEYQYGDMPLDDPQIHVTKITPAEAVEGYVYPYY